MVVDGLSVVLGGDAPDVLEAIQALRLAAWEPILGADAALARFGIDADDAESWHVVIQQEGRVIAAGRLTVREELIDLPDRDSFAPYLDRMQPPVGFASRLVVDSEYRHCGHGARIIGSRLAVARVFGLAEVWGETRTSQIGGLLRHGYELQGPSRDASVPGEWSILRVSL